MPQRNAALVIVLLHVLAVTPILQAGELLNLRTVLERLERLAHSSSPLSRG